jgi:hypothetical protein
MNLDRIERCRVAGHTKAHFFTLIYPCIAFKQSYRKERILFKMKHWRQKMAVVKVACSGNNSVQKSDSGSLKREKYFFDSMLKLARGTLLSG